MQKKNLILAISVIGILLLGLVLFVNSKRRLEYTRKTEGPKLHASALFELARKEDETGELLKAKSAFMSFLNNFPNDSRLAEVGQRLSDLNIKILFSPIISADSKLYEVEPKDSLISIAKKFNTTPELLKKSNNLASERIKPGMRLKVYTGKFSCVVDKSQNILMLKSNEEVLKTYTASTGKNNSTPTGTFKIVSKLTNPVWYKEGSAIPVPPESPENILGSRWMGFTLAGYGIHGTTDPATIGQHVTQGCVRMTNQDVEELYDILPLGTEVTIID